MVKIMFIWMTRKKKEKYKIPLSRPEYSRFFSPRFSSIIRKTTRKKKNDILNALTKD